MFNRGSRSSFCTVAAAAARSLQSCPTLCNPIDSSPPGSPVPGILQARTLEWVAISFSNAWKWKVKVKLLRHVWLLATTWTAAYQALPSKWFSKQKYWSGVPLPSPSASVRSILFLSFIVPIFAWNVPLVSLIFLKRSLIYPFYCFPLFLCIDHRGRLSSLSLLFFWTLHSNGYMFFFFSFTFSISSFLCYL